MDGGLLVCDKLLFLLVIFVVAVACGDRFGISCASSGPKPPCRGGREKGGGLVKPHALASAGSCGRPVTATERAHTSTSDEPP